MSRRPRSVVLVHEFLTQYGGGERILEEFTRMFPKAPIYTLIYDRKKMGRAFADRTIVTSPLQDLPMSRSHYKWYLPLMSWATEQLRIPADVDLVLSDSSAFAKGVRVPAGVPHLCYLHTPTRYLWSSRSEYVADAPIPGALRPFVGPVLDALKRWDYLAAQRPTAYIANSRLVAERLARYYNRAARRIVFPYVNVRRFHVSSSPSDYFFLLSRIEPYKRVDLAAQACGELGLRLKIAGGGTRLAQYRARFAQYPTIEFLGRVADEELPELYANAKAFIFPPEEDAGITPLEAMAAGTPVCAYGRGGALESVKDGLTGTFFLEQTVSALKQVLAETDWGRYTRADIRKHAQQFDVTHFREQINQEVERMLSERTI